MKKTYCTFLLVLLIAGTAIAQKTNDIISLSIGYSSTNIVVKEAVEPTFQFFGNTFKAGKTFVGDGPAFGTSKFINRKLFIHLGFSTFSGQDTKTKVNNNENYYTLKGWQLPLTVNYLLRDSAKKLRINIGAGFQYLKAHLQQFEKITNGSSQTTNQLTNINIRELQLALRPGIQYRIVPNLVASFIVKIAIAANGRYSDQPCLSLQYTFAKKR